MGLECPELESPVLDEFLELKPGAYELLPYAYHILKLSAIKQVVGYIPMNIYPITDNDINALVVLEEEKSKKSRFDLLRAQRKSRGSTKN